MNEQPRDRLAARLARRTWLARLALWWEAAWPALWPVLGVIGVFLVVALSGLPLVLPPLLHLVMLAGFVAALVWAARRAAKRLALPGPAAGERRIERDSGLSHRPIATLGDRPTGNDPVALALWQAHRRRAAERLAALRVAAPKPGLAAIDRRALRGGLAVALVAALVVAGAEAPERLRRALLPAFAGAALPTTPAVRLEAWITPPAYTGAAPIFLDPAGGNAAVPAGSRLQVAVSGGTGGVPDLLVDTAATPFRTLDRGSFAAETAIEAGGRLAVRRDGTTLAQWSLSVRADAPPTVAWDQPPARAQRGLAIRLPWRAEDDWGLATLRVELRLKLRPDAEPVTLDLPIPGGSPRSARGAAQPDLSAHPWAGLEVEARLVATDHADQDGRSDGAFLELPERSFTHPVSQQLIALRKALSVDPTGREPARRELDRITAAPEAFEHDTGTFMALRTARHRLLRDRRPAAVTEAQEILWDVAVALEEGRTDRTARALAEARQALREALEEQRRTPESERTEEQRTETDRRIQELREAIRRHLEALAERLQRENAEALPYDPQQRLMDQRELNRRTQRMQDAARQDRTEDAERELAELEEMLRALEEGRNMRAEDRQRQQQRQRGNQQMGAVQDMVQRQTQMLDRSHQRAEQTDRERQDQRRRPSTSFSQPPPPQQAQPNPERQAQAQQDGRVQRALRRALGELMQQFGELTGDVPQQLGEADRAMRDADENLRSGGDPRDAQQRAIRALTEGGRQMAQQMQRQFGQGQPGEGEEEGEGEGEGMAGGQQGGEGQDQAQEQGPGRDPLGRRNREATGGQDNASDTRVPDEAELLRTRRIQEELRRRGAERERPPAELDYIDRLLRRF